MTITKAYLANAVQKQMGLSKKKSSFLIDSFLEIMKKTLESGDEILISRFGKFMVTAVDRDGTGNQENRRAGQPWIFRKNLPGRSTLSAT